MVLLSSMREAAREIGRRAAGHVGEHHAAGRIAKQYWDTLCAFRQ
jgi:hypothetical protein